MRLVTRVVVGITEHFPIRVSEWIMSYVLAGIGLGLCLIPNAFDASATYSEMDRQFSNSPLGSEYTWGLICLGAATIRLIALVVNGTFKDHFPYSPHLRGVATMVSAYVWGQILLGVVVSFMENGGGWTGIPVYSGIMMLEAWNLFRSWVDVQRVKNIRNRNNGLLGITEPDPAGKLRRSRPARSRSGIRDMVRAKGAGGYD